MRIKFLFFTLSFCVNYKDSKESINQRGWHFNKIISAFQIPYITTNTDFCAMNSQRWAAEGALLCLASLEEMETKREEIQKDLHKARQNNQNQVVQDLLKMQEASSEAVIHLEKSIRNYFKNYNKIMKKFYPKIIGKKIYKNIKFIIEIEETIKQKKKMFAELNSLFNDQIFLDSLGENKNESLQNFKKQQSVFFDFQKKAKAMANMLDEMNLKLMEEFIFLEDKDFRITTTTDEYYIMSQNNLVEIDTLKNQIISAKEQIDPIYGNLNAFIK